MSISNQFKRRHTGKIGINTKTVQHIFFPLHLLRILALRVKIYCVVNIPANISERKYGKYSPLTEKLSFQLIADDVFCSALSVNL